MSAKLGLAARNYVTSPGTRGAVGGPQVVALAAEIAGTLANRARPPGPTAQSDESLATVACVLLDLAGRNGNVDAVDVERIARHVGFAGSILAASVFPVEGSDEGSIGGATAPGGGWKKALSPIAPNLPVTRFGVCVADATHAAAIVFGDVSLELEPVPRHPSRGDRLRLRGELAPRFDFGHAYVTSPDGTVQETPIAARRITVDVPLPSRGIYRVEIMGDGVRGPTVLMNVPIYVDAPEPSHLTSTPSEGGGGGGQTPSPAQFELRMLELLNAARLAGGLGPVAADAQLRAVALSHSEDMERSHFFGHVSPTTGTVADRLSRAGVQVSTAGENLSDAATPEEAHRGLMESPGHRANMLGPRFTHVGIGVVRAADVPPRFLATVVFAHRTPVDQPWTAADATSAIAALRKKRGVPALRMDPDLRAGAEAGMKVFAKTSSPSEAATAASGAFTRVAAARDPSASKGALCVHFFEILDPDQLASIPVLTEPGLLRIGLAVSARAAAGARKFAVLMLAEGGACEGRR